METRFCFSISESSQVGEARRAAVAISRLLGFHEANSEKAAIVTTEMASNLVKHTNGGELLIQVVEQQGIPGLELLALDDGPGIRNIGESLRDGYSTAGSRGEGLGAIKRLAGQFDLYSQADSGTALMARLWAQPLAQASSRPELELGAVCVPKSGESANGDGWGIQKYADRNLLLVVDGLGHGPGAAAATQEAMQVFQKPVAWALPALMEELHQKLRRSRGAAVALAEIVPSQEVHFVGVGNIGGAVLIDDKSHHVVSHNGTVGHTIHRIQSFTYPWRSDGLLVLHSDGLSTRWNLNSYPGLSAHHPSLIAGVLYRDFKRGTDDATVLVAKERR
jgi:anti-sigma regulatory factor (Ser/Thr protein kinase)